MPNYLVISDEYGEVTPVLDYGQGPTEYGRDICIVLGVKSKNEAKWFAVKFWRYKGYKCLDDTYHHPLKGVTVESFPDISEYPLKTPEGEIMETWEDVLNDDNTIVVN